MADEPTPTPAVAPGDAPVTPATPPAQAGDPKANAAFAALRTEAETAKQRAAELESKLTALERKDMDEKTRLEAELADARKEAEAAKTLRADREAYETAFQQACADELSRVPEEKRATIERLTQHTPAHERLTAIREFVQALGVAPSVAGTVTQPAGVIGGAPGAPPAAEPLSVKDIDKMSFTNALKSSGRSIQKSATPSDYAEMQRDVAAMKETIKTLTAKP